MSSGNLLAGDNISIALKNGRIENKSQSTILSKRGNIKIVLN
jgi:hypothetical protein